MRTKRIVLSLSALLGMSIGFIPSQGCVFDDCIYFATYGYQGCGRLEPVVSTNSEGMVAIEEFDGKPPSGCTCVTELQKEILSTEPSSQEVNQVIANIEASARQNCVELAQELGAEPEPCLEANLNVGSVSVGEQTSEACWYIYDSSDPQKCPLPENDGGEDEVGETEADEESDGGESETGEGDGGRPLPDLPGGKQP
ncbi:hypothetical protein G6O69_02320 [Pseudenhygromyxa sp. WMMC2535]|uniref:hypothetical protein n=1 Tax=Pseudenhygromyxa sp. WMMC2535 TaxID=2712867 RepID=UPI00155757EE|nr:hypothetical protein [Pseudenhygromyxa sp. WMMC2535]NVB36649.1 hypothetical protein [Pseudenhygromyxa sp. WMMC2535]